MDADGLRDWLALSGGCAAAAYLFALGRAWPLLRAWGQFAAFAAFIFAMQRRRDAPRHASRGVFVYATWMAVYAHVPAAGPWAWLPEAWSVLVAVVGLTTYSVPPGIKPGQAVRALGIIATATVLLPSPSAGPANEAPWQAVLRALLFASAWQMNALRQARASTGEDSEAIFLPLQTLWILTTWSWVALPGGAIQAAVLLFLVLREGPRHAE